MVAEEADDLGACAPPVLAEKPEQAQVRPLGEPGRQVRALAARDPPPQDAPGRPRDREVEEDNGVARREPASQRRLEVAVDDPGVLGEDLVELAEPFIARAQHPPRAPTPGVEVVDGGARGGAEASRERRLAGAVGADDHDARSERGSTVHRIAQRRTDVTLKIPRPLYEQLAQVIEGTGFRSVTEFCVYVLRDLVATRAADSGDALTRAEVDAIRRRLQSLGYLDP